MRHSHDEHQQHLVFDLVDDAVVTHPEAVEILGAFEPLRSWGPRVLDESFQLRDDLPLRVFTQLADSAGSTILDDDLVRHLQP